MGSAHDGPHGVVAVGDSWLTGYGLPLGGLTCMSWAGWLAWGLVTCLTQHAVNGATAAQVARDQLPLLAGHRYRLGLAWPGVNDLSHLDPDAFTTTTRLTCTALAACSDVVAVATLPTALRLPDLGWRATAVAVGTANDVVRRVAATSGVALVELSDALTGRWDMAPDRQHPTSIGQLAAARIAARALEPLALARELPDPAGVGVPAHQQRWYDVSTRERVRGLRRELRHRLADEPRHGARG
jgi:hypothetical protein